MKKALVILNPCSGKMRGSRHLGEIVQTFTENGYTSTVLTTTKPGDGTEYVKQYGKAHDIIVAVGGDGTFNEVTSGVLKLDERKPIGYIPCGSTNDFAMSLKMPKSIRKAAETIVTGTPKAFDLGSFNGRGFSYVATFGAFTRASYSAPQNLKNVVGHLAYIIEGAKSLDTLKPSRVKITADGETFEGDYLFGAFSNSTSMGGVLKLKPELVNMSDGKFEMILIEMPAHPAELAVILKDLKVQKFTKSKHVILRNASEFIIETEEDIPWSLDGEYQPGEAEIRIRNIHHAIDLIVEK